MVSVDGKMENSPEAPRIFDAVQQEAVIAGASAGGVHRDGGAAQPGGGCGIRSGGDSPGGERGQLQEIAAVKRKIHGLLLADHLSHGGGVGLQHCRARFHVHGFGHVADLQRNVDASGLVDLQLYILRDSALEAGVARRNAIVSGRQFEEGVASRSSRWRPCG